MIKVRITEPGFQHYTGPLGGVEFVDGQNVSHISELELTRVSACMRIERIEEDGKSSQAGIAAVLVSSRNVGAPILTKQSETPPAEPDATISESIEDPTISEPTPAYTLDELGKIADEQGIGGLRKIAEPLNIRARSIPELIKAIHATVSKSAI